MPSPRRRFEIDSEIKRLLPPLTEEERLKLRTMIQKRGRVDPLIVGILNGRRLLIDGHNRLEICEELDLDYPTREEVFERRGELLQWVIDNQLSRRNLPPERIAYFRGKDYLNQKQVVGGQLPKGGDQNGPPLKTAEKVAEKHGVGQTTIKRDAEFAKAVDKIAEAKPEVAEAIINGQSTATKQEIIKVAAKIEPGKGAAKTVGELFNERCGKCKRLTHPVPGCEACAMAKAQAKAARNQPKIMEIGDEPKRRREPRNGRPDPSNEFFAELRRVIFPGLCSWVDRVYKEAGLMNEYGQPKRDEVYRIFNDLIGKLKGAAANVMKHALAANPPPNF